MNFGDLVTEFYSSGFAYFQQETNGPVRVQRWINQSYQELCDLEDWPFLEATATGTAPLTISDLEDVIDVQDTTTRNTLVQSDHAAMSEVTGDLTITGTPTYYYITGGAVINVFPVSTTVQLSVRYIKNPTDLANNADTPIVPTPFHDLIVLGAWRRGLLDDSAAGDYSLIAAEYDRRLSTMRQSQLVPPRYQTVTGASGDW